MEYHLSNSVLKHSLARNKIGLDKLRPYAFALAKLCTDVPAWQRMLQTWPGGT